MSRCMGCNEVLTPTELTVKNKHTEDFEELCKHCRDPHWDTGIQYAFNSPNPIGYRNEASDVVMDEPPGGLTSLEEIVKHIVQEGSISTQDPAL